MYCFGKLLAGVSQGAAGGVFGAVFYERVGDGLPLHVAGGVGAANTERDDVVSDPARAGPAGWPVAGQGLRRLNSMTVVARRGVGSVGAAWQALNARAMASALCVIFEQLLTTRGVDRDHAGLPASGAAWGTGGEAPERIDQAGNDKKQPEDNLDPNAAARNVDCVTLSAASGADHAAVGFGSGAQVADDSRGWNKNSPQNSKEDEPMIDAEGFHVICSASEWKKC